MNWLDSIYSDGTRMFVSNPTPALGDTVEISIRFLADAPVKAVLLRSLPNGAERYDEAHLVREEGGLAYYTAELPVTEYLIRYQFYLVTEDAVYFYTQNGVTTYIPDHTYDFKLIAGYRQPSWVRGAVFYQIFPERFCNGDPSNDVRDGEYTYRGDSATQVKAWSEAPKPFAQARALDFYGGDLDGVIQKLPYLQELGVTALYLNPVFRAFSTHKYDCVDYCHVDEHFGGDEALARLCDAVHRAGMRIILDISINHTGIEHHWVKEGKPYYFKNPDGTLRGWNGVETLPELDYRSDELRDAIYRGKDAVLRKWLRPPYAIDGWRFDVADVFARNNDVQLSEELWPEICAAIREENPEAIIIAEDWGDCGQYLQGRLWNTPMNYYGFGRIIRQFAGLGDLFLDRHPLLRGVPYRMTARDVVKRTDEHYAKLPQVIADQQMNLFDSHDIPRMHNYPEIGFAKWKSAVIAQLLWTGIPCIYYGDELAIDGYTTEDAGYRFPMPWGRESEDGKKHLALTRRMAELRRTVDAFAGGGRKVLYADGGVLAVARFSATETYVGVISMEDAPIVFDLPLGLVGASRPIGTTDAFGAELHGYSTSDSAYTIEVEPLGSYLFECR